jgi:hypothetical protein
MDNFENKEPQGNQTEEGRDNAYSNRKVVIIILVIVLFIFLIICIMFLRANGVKNENQNFGFNVEFSENDMSEMIDRCNRLSSGKRFMCINAVANELKDQKACDFLESADIEGCKKNFNSSLSDSSLAIIPKDADEPVNLSRCEELAYEESLKCVLVEAMKEFSICDNVNINEHTIKHPNWRDHCITMVALNKNDFKYCSALDDANKLKDCQTIVVTRNKVTTKDCSEMDGFYSEDCYFVTAKLLNYEGLCNKIKDASKRSACQEEVNSEN